MRYSTLTSTACGLLLLQLVSAEVLPTLDPCWQSCLSHNLPCPDARWRCFCRQARTTDLLSDSIACIRSNCTNNEPFSPSPLLDPFLSSCKTPIPTDILASASTQAEAPASSTSNVFTASNSKAARTVSSDGSITTTLLGIATDAKGNKETFTVPALIGSKSTVYGNPITSATVTPTSTVTLPWPTLPVGYFSSSHPPAAPKSTLGSTGLVVQASGATPGQPKISGESSSTTTTTSVKAAQKSNDITDEGTILDESGGSKTGAKSSLGLMVVLLVGVMWF